MNIQSMLVRLGDALGGTELAQQILLHRPLVTSTAPAPPESSPPAPVNSVNLVVGYNGSSNSQTALDLTLWIAHQTRLATRQAVNVQVVYVIAPHPVIPVTPIDKSALSQARQIESVVRPTGRRGVGVLERTTTQRRQITDLEAISLAPAMTQLQRFEEADRILWQARNLAEEWRGVLKTHLRFGEVATELGHVAQQERASVLLVGCDASEHWLIQQLGRNFPVPVVGIPDALSC